MRGPRGMNASDFWDVVGTNALARDEIVLLTRYLVNSYRTNGFKIPAEMFMTEANIEEVGELDDPFDDYLELHKKDNKGMDYWSFFCHERLKLKRLQENNVQLPSIVDEDNGTISGPEKASIVDEENGTVSGPEKAAYRKLAEYICRYFNQNVKYADCLVEKHGKGQQANAASRKRKGSEENVQEEKKGRKGSEENVQEEEKGRKGERGKFK